MGRRAVLFDLDGTLVEMRDLHWQALNLALVEHRQFPIPYGVHISEYDGLPTSRKLEMLGAPLDLRAAISSKKQDYTLELVKGLRPDVRLNRELEHIGKEATLCVVSNALLSTCVAVLLRTGIGKYVHMLIAGPHEKGKPHPEPYLKALSAGHLDPGDCVAVEDNHYGVEAAERAGLRCLRVSGPCEITYHRVMSMFPIEIQFA